MTSEGFVAGKDASLESSISSMQSKLEKLGFHIEEPSWLNSIEGVWSVHIGDRDCPLLFTNGKGASEQASRASALVDYNSGNDERGICALPYVRERDGATVWFPVNIIGNLYVNNGMSAGNTPAEARTQALSEIFERAVKFRIIEKGLCLPDAPDAMIARHPRIAAGIRDLRAAGFGVLVKDASLGGQYPVMNVTLLNPRDQGCFSSFGAHPRVEIALERALTELLQGRALDGFPRTKLRPRRNRPRAKPGNPLRRFQRNHQLELPARHARFCVLRRHFGSTTAEDYAWSVGAIHATGHDM